MNNPERRSLVWQLLLAFSSIIMAAAVLMHLSNRYASQYPAELLRYNAKALFFIFGPMIVIFGLFIRYRLRSYLRAPDSGRDASDQTHLWMLLTRHPSEIFKLTLVLCFIAAAAYKFAEYQYLQQANLVPGETVWLWLIKGTVLNLTTAILLAAVFYGLTRLILRPHVLQVQKIDVSKVSFRSFSRQLVFTFIILLTMVMIRIVWYVTNAQLHQQPVRWQVLAGISIIGLIGGLLLFYLIANGFRRQVQSIVTRIYGLVREGKSGAPRKVDVTNSDETGELAAALNHLQLRLSRDYAELEEELLLARKVRDKLFPVPEAVYGGMEVSFRGPADGRLDGSFYDMAEADERRMAFISGCVPEKGAAAVLMISALLALFRTEVRRGGSAAGMLSRLEAEWKESFPDWGAVPAALVVLDRSDDTVQVSLAGGAEAVCITRDGARQALLMGPKAEAAEAAWRPGAGEVLQIGHLQAHAAQEANSQAGRGIWVQITRR